MTNLHASEFETHAAAVERDFPGGRSARHADRKAAGQGLPRARRWRQAEAQPAACVGPTGENAHPVASPVLEGEAVVVVILPAPSALG